MKPQRPAPPDQSETPSEEIVADADSPSDAPEAMEHSQPLAEVERGPTIEFQRRQAVALTKYFENVKLREITKQPVFGWTPKNEIGNGRWVMFGLLVGLLTEYATGVNIIDQIKLVISNLGIADIYD